MREMRRRLALVAVVGALAALCAPTRATATSMLSYGEDGSGRVTKVFGASFATLGSSFETEYFVVENWGLSPAEFPSVGLLSSGATLVRLKGGVTGQHTLSLWVSNQDYTLPAGFYLDVRSGASGVYTPGSGGFTFQAYADEGNALFGVSDFTNGLQTPASSPSSGVVPFSTGEAVGLFSNAGGVYSLTSVATITLSGSESLVKFSGYADTVSPPTPVPESATLSLLGLGLLLVAGVARRP